LDSPTVFDCSLNKYVKSNWPSIWFKLIVQYDLAKHFTACQNIYSFLSVALKLYLLTCVRKLSSFIKKNLAILSENDMSVYINYVTWKNERRFQNPDENYFAELTLGKE
jgi:hypothetical protein